MPQRALLKHAQLSGHPRERGRDPRAGLIALPRGAGPRAGGGPEQHRPVSWAAAGGLCSKLPWQGADAQRGQRILLVTGQC